ncbi:DNA repair protein RadC [Anaerovoracaceae bacterium 42-11]|nr:DNA repair protein RadC [Emergencia sp.]
MQIKLLPENERPVEKACRAGVDKLSSAELLALILHTGTKNKSAIGLGEDVLSAFSGGISQLGGCTLEDLLKIEGIGPSKACSILGAIELGKRIAASMPTGRSAITGSEDIARLFMEELRYQKKEHFKSVLVNTKSEIIAVDAVSVGELSSTVIHPREVFQLAIRKSAAAVIFIHNHPSGDPTPSSQDIETTKRLIEAGKLLGIRVLDHVIIGDGRYVSMGATGLME